MGTSRRARLAGSAVVAGVAAALLTGCGGSGAIPTPPMEADEVAEVARGGPDCLSREVLLELFGVEPAGSARVASRSGVVPEGFAPVQVVLCRPGPLSLAEPEPRVIVPTIPSPLPTAPTADASHERRPTAATVKQVTLTGDLAPLLTALARTSAPGDGRPCPAVWQSKPQIYLVDADGGAVRPRWPVTACGFLQKGAAESLAQLEEISSVDLTAELDLG